MTSIRKPMLAANDSPDVRKIKYPVLASFKTDGIRMLLHPDLGPVARSFKPIPNDYIRDKFQYHMHTTPALKGLDGELVTYTDGVLDDFSTIQGKVMSRDGKPDCKLMVFDYFRSMHEPFRMRITQAENIVTASNFDRLVFVPHYVVKSAMDLEIMKQAHLDEGHEGTMSRAPDAWYKEGRSTLKQEWLLKHKVWYRAEGTVIGYEELMINGNEQYVNELGDKVRSSSKSGKVPGGTLGAVILHTEWGEVRLGTGKGLDRSLRDTLWREREQNLGRLVTFKYMPHGTKNKPRLPGWVGFRNPIDMSD